jgi:hypothetical protein
MLNEIGGKQNIPGFLSRVKDKQDHTRLMGFGHRVYKNYDPRAKVMRQTCHEVLTSLGITHDPLLELAMEMEQIALKDDYFISKKLYPERRLLLGHHLPGDRHPDLDVHRAVRRGAHRRLDLAVERDDRGSRPEDRPAAPALQRPDRAALQAAAPARIEYRAGLLARLAPDGQLGDCPEAPDDAARGAARSRGQRQRAPAEPSGPAGGGRIGDRPCSARPAGRAADLAGIVGSGTA